MNILVIDDDNDTANLFCEYLTYKGHNCDCINDGRNGLEKLQNRVYDVTLLEINLPKFNGFDIINSLYKSGRLRIQNIIILTRLLDISDAKISDLKKLGISSFFQKPIDINLLLNEIIQPNKIKKISTYQ